MAMIDTNHLELIPRLTKTRTPVRRSSFQGNGSQDVFNNVRIRNIIEQLGEKLDVGTSDDDNNQIGGGGGGGVAKVKSRSFQPGFSGVPKSKSRSSISLPVRVVRSTVEGDLAVNVNVNATSSSSADAPVAAKPPLMARHSSLSHDFSAHSTTSSSPPIEQILESDDMAGVISPISHGSYRKSHYGSSRIFNPEDLPPAFRISLDKSRWNSETNHSSSAAAATTRKQQNKQAQKQIMRKKSKSPRRRRHGGKDEFRYQPAKLLRKWPPVLKKNLAEPDKTMMELMHSSLTVIRSMECVTSQISSFEPITTATISQNKNSSTSDDFVLLFEGEDDRPQSTNTGADAGGVRTTKSVEEEADVPLEGVTTSALKSALKSGKCKASLRIRWRGPEIFFIEARSGRKNKLFQPHYFDDLLLDDDRFPTDEFGSETDGSFGSLLVDRFAGGGVGPRASDECPSHPSRRPPQSDDWSDYDESETSISHDNHDLVLPEEQDSTNGPTPASSYPTRVEDEVRPVDFPAIWITVMEGDGEAGGRYWRVKRVWDDPILDSREVERIVADEHLLDMVKNLSGIPAMEDAYLFDEKSNDHVEKKKNQKKREEGHDAVEIAENDGIDLSHWSIKKFYDIDGEIVDELQMSEKSFDEKSMLHEINALVLESSELALTGVGGGAAAIIPPPPVAIEDKWNAKSTTIDAKQDVPVSKAAQSALELHQRFSVSQLGVSNSSLISGVDPATAAKSATPAEKEEDLARSFSSLLAIEDSAICLTMDKMASENSREHCDDHFRKSITDEDIPVPKPVDESLVENIPKQNEDDQSPKTTREVRILSSTATSTVVGKGEAVPGLKIKKKKKQKSHRTLADLLSPPPVTTFHG